MNISFVYFLVDADASCNRFKIGVSICPSLRHKQLSHTFDFEKSIQIGYDAKDVYKAEGFLHRYFRNYRINPDDVGACVGRTEWFDLDCFAEAVELVHMYESRTPPGPIDEISFALLNVKIPRAVHRVFKTRAAEENRTIQEMILELMTHYLMK